MQRRLQWRDPEWTKFLHSQFKGGSSLDSDVLSSTVAAGISVMADTLKWCRWKKSAGKRAVFMRPEVKMVMELGWVGPQRHTNKLDKD